MIEGRKGSQKILTFPKGKFYIEKYNDWVVFDDSFFSEIIEAYNSELLKKPFVDKNHELKECYGEMSNPVIEDDGLYFDVELNDTGVELIQNGLYTSISPTFGDMTDTSGKKWNNVLVSISLTNVPALQNNYPSLQDQFELSMGNNLKCFSLHELKAEGDKMKNLEITRKLELSPEASEEAIAMAIQSLIDQGAEAADLVAAKESMIAELTKKIDELTGKVESAEKAVEEMANEKEKTEFEGVFGKALEGGVILPAEKESYQKLYKVDKELCVNTLKKFSVKPTGFTTLSNDSSMTDEDYKIMEAQGLDKSNQKHLELYKKANNLK